jgi:antitoxin CptB
VSVTAVTQAADSRKTDESNPRRLLWHCRRGMKELDILLERFALEALPHASPQERQAFTELLEHPDPVLAGYLLGGETPAEVHLAGVVRRIRGT